MLPSDRSKVDAGASAAERISALFLGPLRIEGCRRRALVI
jgi:hypothetical protein